MKVIAYTALHYGRDYLAYAIRSVIDAIDEYHVLYTSEGSHGHRSGARCPETRGELQAIARAVAGDKLHWHDGHWTQEGQQRDAIFQIVPNADVILVLDADEIWPAKLVEMAVQMIKDGHGWLEVCSRVRVPMIHYWRSMHRAVLHDPAYPVRILMPKQYNAEATLSTPYRINHFGYAQRPEIVEYKLKVHGHKNEFRHDVDWFQDVFMANRQTDCHPVGSEYWNPEPVNPLDYLPEWMHEHPYYGLEVIE